MIDKKKLAALFIDMADKQGIKGKKRDAYALEFFRGACAVAQQLGDNSLDMIIFMVSIRGYSFVTEMLKEVKQ